MAFPQPGYWSAVAQPGGWPGVASQLWRQFFWSPAVAATIPFAGSWQAIKYIAQGASSHLVLFARIDQTNTLRERIVVKELVCDPDRWFDPRFWMAPSDADGNRDYSAGISHAQSVETYIHSKVSAAGSPAIVGYLGRSPVEKKHWRYRVYLEYCAHGDLAGVINHYRDPENFPDLETYNGLPDINIPEPFIIRCILQLCEAALVMQNGTRDGTTLLQWREVLHRDIKLSNIFLQEPDQSPGSQWRLYPVPKLGDWDIAMETSEDDPNNPRAFQNAGTLGWTPPEMFLWINRDNRSYFDPPKMDAKAHASCFTALNAARQFIDFQTQVFAIGLVGFCLIHRIVNPRIPDLTGAAQVALPEEDEGGPILISSNYTHVVNDIIMECLRFDPAQRPTLEQIQARLNPKGLDPDNLLYRSMRKVKPNAHPWYSEEQRGGKQKLQMNFQDNYRLGLTRNQLPRVVHP